MKKIGIFLIIGSFLFSCGDKKKEPVTDINDVLPSSERYAEGKESEEEPIVVSYFDSLSSFSQRVAIDLDITEGVRLIDSLWLPQRFDNSGVEKWLGQGKESEMVFARFSFRDSLNMKNCLFNWFDCFGANCSSLKLFSDQKINNDPFLIYAIDREFVYISSSNLNEKRMLTQMEIWFRNKTPLFVLSQSNGDKVKWWKLEKRKWLEIKQGEI